MDVIRLWFPVTWNPFASFPHPVSVIIRHLSQVSNRWMLSDYRTTQKFKSQTLRYQSKTLYHSVSSGREVLQHIPCIDESLMYLIISGSWMRVPLGWILNLQPFQHTFDEIIIICVPKRTVSLSFKRFDVNHIGHFVPQVMFSKSLQGKWDEGHIENVTPHDI